LIRVVRLFMLFAMRGRHVAVFVGKVRRFEQVT